jgi:hypothetical protein
MEIIENLVDGAADFGAYNICILFMVILSLYNVEYLSLEAEAAELTAVEVLI